MDKFCFDWFYGLYTKHTTILKSFLADVADEYFIFLMESSKKNQTEAWFKSKLETTLRLVVQTSTPHMSGDYRWHSRNSHHHVEYWVWDETGLQGAQQERYEIVYDHNFSSWRVILCYGDGSVVTTHTCVVSTENRFGITKCPPERGWKKLSGAASDLTVILKDIEDDGMDTSLNATDDVDDADEDDADASSMVAEEGEDDN